MSVSVRACVSECESECSVNCLVSVTSFCQRLETASTDCHFIGVSQIATSLLSALLDRLHCCKQVAYDSVLSPLEISQIITSCPVLPGNQRKFSLFISAIKVQRVKLMVTLKGSSCI